MTFTPSFIVHIDCRQCGRAYSFDTQPPVYDDGSWGYIDQRCPACKTTPTRDELLNAKTDLVTPAEKVNLHIRNHYSHPPESITPR